MEPKSLNVYNHNLYDVKYIIQQWYQSRLFGMTDCITITQKSAHLTDRITTTKKESPYT